MMAVSRRESEKKECKRERKKKFVLFSTSSCSAKGSFSYFWVCLYFIGLKEMCKYCGFNLHSVIPVRPLLIESLLIVIF